LLDFHRAKEAIEEGRRAVERVAHTLSLLEQPAAEGPAEAGAVVESAS
jgi:hypothetical protein